MPFKVIRKSGPATQTNYVPTLQGAFLILSGIKDDEWGYASIYDTTDNVTLLEIFLNSSTGKFVPVSSSS